MTLMEGWKMKVMELLRIFRCYCTHYMAETSIKHKQKRRWVPNSHMKIIINNLIYIY
jgi:hypothetical protein